MVKTVTAIPGAARLIEAMRDIGYSLETAVADLVDNSITAGARRIRIFAQGGESQARIGLLDDGRGMSEDELLEAMQVGCRNPVEQRATTDLGRFGLGLKTASFSQCRRVTVLTTRNGLVSAARWDLNYVAEKDEWLVQIPEDTLSIPWADQLGCTGTLVIWEDLDRLLETGRQDSGSTYFARRLDDTCQHLELVFNRFLAGEPGLRRVEIRVNERLLEAFDPFHQAHPATIIGTPEVIGVDGESVRVQAFTLPHHRRLTPPEWERLGGPEGYVKNQGFYVYREKRLILHGTWFSLARQTELTKLVRVRVDIPNSLDSKWKIDVKKASAQPPLPVRNRLRSIIEPIVAGSKRIYLTRGKRLLGRDPLPVWNRIKTGNQISYRLNRDNPMLADFYQRLPEELKSDFIRILEIAGTSLPIDTLFADLGGHPQEMDDDCPSGESLEYFVKATYEYLRVGGHPLEMVRVMIEAAEPCRRSPARAKEILNRLLEEQSDG